MQIQGNEFPDKASKQRWIDRYLYLYGRRSSLFTLTTERFSSVAQAEELLALDVMKKVRHLPALRLRRRVVMRIITVTRNLADRNITLGLWAGPAGLASSVLGGGSSSASNGGGTGSKAFVVGVQYLRAVSQVAQSTIDSGSDGPGAEHRPHHAGGRQHRHRAGRDSDFASVALLLHFGGADGSTTITDSSSYADRKDIVVAHPDRDQRQRLGRVVPHLSLRHHQWRHGEPPGLRAMHALREPAAWRTPSNCGSRRPARPRPARWPALQWCGAMAPSGHHQCGRLADHAGGTSTNFTASTGGWHFLQTVVDTSNVAVTRSTAPPCRPPAPSVPGPARRAWSSTQPPTSAGATCSSTTCASPQAWPRLSPRPHSLSA